MTTIPIYRLNAFTRGAAAPFSGNPAAVCPLDAWLDDAVMQHIAAENNVSETATLAAAHVVFSRLGFEGERIAFHAKSGMLRVKWRGVILQHFFNRQTHHRGQAHGLLSQTDVAPPVLDLLYFIRG